MWYESDSSSRVRFRFIDYTVKPCRHKHNCLAHTHTHTNGAEIRTQRGLCVSYVGTNQCLAEAVLGNYKLQLLSILYTTSSYNITLHNKISTFKKTEIKGLKTKVHICHNIIYILNIATNQSCADPNFHGHPVIHRKNPGRDQLATA